MEPAAAAEASSLARRESGGGWSRAVALLLVAISVWIGRSSVVLVGVVYIALASTLPVRRWPGYTLGLLAALLVFTGEREPLWWVERGWALLVAGCFVALTLRWPAARFLSRALGAVAAAAALAALLVGARGGWPLVEWQVGDELPFGMGRALSWMWEAAQQGTPPPSPEVAEAVLRTMYETMDAQARLFPALAALGSLAGLGVSWWMYRQVALGEDTGLRPLREFRFNDHLIWLFIAGLALVLVDAGDPAARAGSNVVTFMGALYVLRGAGVVAFFGGGQTFFGLVMLVMALLLAAPVVMAGALVVGLGDTWLDLRGRARALTT
jgi:hypothetical protein